MAKKDKQQDEKITTSIYLTKQMCDEIDKKADREHISRNEQIRKYIEKGLSIESYEENIDLITSIIHEEIDASIKALGNRLAAMINRMTIISAAGYYANIALIADLIDIDRYSSFEKIERIARKRALAYANMKSGDALNAFMDDEEMKKAVKEIKGGNPAYVDFDV
ncbi:MAG: ribbon-helix-helix protein, CopG family [Clostridia bacterium]|nr:ribbon-helix-helix protein, CopG family [Clostridia bacterium]